MSPLCLVALAMLVSAPAVQTQHPQQAETDPAQTTANVKDIVTIFFKNWETKELMKSEPLFVSADSPVIIYDNYKAKQNVLQQKAAELLKQWQANSAKFLRVQSTHVDLLNKSLAVARSEFVLGGFNGRAVFSLIFKDGRWKIASLVVENRFTW
jgi:hypothetical protein